MNTYKLYDTTLIANDETLRNFALSVIRSIPEDDLRELKLRWLDDPEDAHYMEEFMNRVNTALWEDLTRTDINYPSLMLRYAGEIGPLLYHMENNGAELPDTISLSFFGEEAKECFLTLVQEYIFLIQFRGDPLAVGHNPTLR